MQILEAKSKLVDFSVDGKPLGLFTLKTQYGYDLGRADSGHYLFSCVSASTFVFFDDSEVRFACDVVFVLSATTTPTIAELLALAEGARDEMNRILDAKLEERALGVMQIARLDIAETEVMLEAALQQALGK